MSEQEKVMEILNEEGKIFGISRSCMASRLRYRGFKVNTKDIPKIIKPLIKLGKVAEKKDLCAHHGKIWIIYPILD